MRDRLPNSTYRAYKESIEKREPLSREVATLIANAMKVGRLKKVQRILLIDSQH